MIMIPEQVKTELYYISDSFDNFLYIEKTYFSNIMRLM